MSFSCDDDHRHMARALQLAERGRYITSPNPRVGCVIVRDDRVLGEGWTQPAGHNHAEIEALNDAAARGEDVRGATAYVTLEPCSHFGRTPPCADALIRAGLGRVLAAMEDPNPLVSGNGLRRLEAAGIRTASGLLAQEAGELNAGFVSRMTRGRPWVRLKIAASADGRTALANGESKWITGPAARRDVQHWRASACAVLTGIGTVKADDPQLNVRELATPRQPIRVVVDARLETPSDAAMLRSGGAVWIACADDSGTRADALRAAGAQLIPCATHHGRIDLATLMQQLGERQINELLVEAGAQITGSFISAGLADEILLYLAPCLMGDTARGLGALPEWLSMADIPRLRWADARKLGDDLRLVLRP
ncbi:bifunctional diaminohydroxyphosphoribosylaminopyrimidine deaminase/5-amino-6-(5-phosphoribosylamino)uracil reductase RibD [Niveibacterium sp. 24ML]|uniref:bifunctional diaminohydroxyphosphoribosylaminopyrimidine deaminase/5-amino-6-(5-phosphoribosylamino)uracil reductase RibD n=1 Tax=Niveibacterium sp. 24ML TaxID=2985512 RepID=UPI0022711F96|nr:bifunctional diaminohydroxyphosphoribosylaminopyrimidine deaminase/5-amino-6-(5-phosphoribosylamino)uracil reductase RibD [Niveibacterium sp. 24ML]MCX9156789.1 bifunctional diaminohydroxyphosphoribosylaminopyrimidine deaminase/5-amino-6-(5-phosphoribosylamino)uracil reductase RibD [Niveibacterium sp. 24ML]